MANSSIFNHAPDFEVTYRLFSAEEGGRMTPPYQGVRWDFMYDEYREGLYIIHPIIIDTSTEEVYRSAVPIPALGKATMWILNPEFRPFIGSVSKQEHGVTLWKDPDKLPFVK